MLGESGRSCIATAAAIWPRPMHITALLLTSLFLQATPIDLGGTPFTPKGSIFGHVRQVVGPYTTWELAVVLSNQPDACTHWPESSDRPDTRQLVIKLSKLRWGSGHTEFLQPDVGTYDAAAENPNGENPRRGGGRLLGWRRCARRAPGAGGPKRYGASH